MRRFPSFIVLASLASPCFAGDLPTVDNPAAKEMIDQFVKDRALLQSPDLFAMPNPVPAWPCDVPETERYKLAGLMMAHPELRRDIEKSTRKMMREMGIANSPGTTYSNIQIIPLKAQCEAGKLEGELQILASYDSRMEIATTTPMGAEIVKGTSTTNMHFLVRSRRTMHAGAEQGMLTAFMETTTRTDTHYDNAQMEAQMQKSSKELGLNKPVMSRSINYTSKEGIYASFTESKDKQVSGGLFGVSVKEVPSLLAMFMTPVDEHRRRTETYKDGKLLGVSWMKDNKPHGEQIIYSDNYLKKNGMRIDQMTNMENAREVTIDGVDLIETRNCYQNGVPIKTDKCSNE